jgi:hypothetical protein
MSTENLQALADAQGEKVRKMKEAIKADPASHTKEELNKEVRHAPLSHLAKALVQSEESIVAHSWHGRIRGNLTLKTVDRSRSSRTSRPSLRPPLLRTYPPRSSRCRPPSELLLLLKRTRPVADTQIHLLLVPAASTLTDEHDRVQKYDLVRSVGEECIADAELLNLVSKKPGACQHACVL